MKAEDLGVDLTPRLEILKVVSPPVRQGGAKVSFPSSASLPLTELTRNLPRRLHQ